MTVQTSEASKATRPAPPSIFSRILVGADGSSAGSEAVRQAGVLLEPEGELTVLGAFDALDAFVGGTVGMTPSVRIDSDAQREAAEAAVAQAVDALPGTTGKVVRGPAWKELIREAERERDGLIVVGSHGTGRAAGILIGSTATELVHNAPCSVLIARKTKADFPRSIVVGIDGSPASAYAFEIAAELSARFGVRLWNVVAHGGKAVDPVRIAELVGHRREDLQDHPVDALVTAAAEADLLVVGSRGLHGLRSLGSVSERVAHRADCSVLVVRQAPWGAT
jgi:nucleotide-binding universal stress UspA family protein